MSTGYERSGRTSQKQRTRQALISAARRLLASGHVPTVEEVAAAAAISRTTAYRYFASQGELLLASHPELVPGSLLPASGAPAAPADRLAAVVDELTHLTVEREPQLRAMLRLSLDPAAPRDELTLRRGRAIGWIEEALEAAPLAAAARHRLALAIRAVVGIEGLVWLTDVAGLDRAAAAALQRWAAQALLRAALAEVEPAPRSARAGRRRKPAGR